MRVGANPHRAAEPIGAKPESIDWLSNDEVTEFNPMSLLRSNSSSSSYPLPVCPVLQTDPALSVSVQDCTVPLIVLKPQPSNGGGVKIDPRTPQEKRKWWWGCVLRKSLCEVVLGLHVAEPLYHPSYIWFSRRA